MASRPGRSRLATSIRHSSDATGSTPTRTWFRPGSGDSIDDLARDVGGVLREQVRAGRMSEPVSGERVVPEHAECFGATALDGVAGLQSGESLLLEQLQHGGEELVEPTALRGLQVSEREAQQVEGAGALRGVEVDRELHDRLLLERVDAHRHSEHEARLLEEERHLLLGRRAEVEALDEAAGELDRRLVLPRRLEDERGEQQPVGVREGSVLLPGPGVVARELPDPVDEREAQDLAGIELERVAAATVAIVAASSGSDALQEAGGLEEPPRPHVAGGEHREQALRRGVVPSERRVLVVRDVAEPLEQRGPGARVGRAASAASSPRCSASRSGGVPTRSTTPSRATSHPPGGSGPEFTKPLRCALRRLSSRALRSGGVMIVVTSTTSRSAAYSSRSSTPSRRPIVAKISPTSPRGIMPSPTSSLSPGEPKRPAEAASFPRTATTSSAAAIPSTVGCTNSPTSMSMPICRKKTGMNRCPTGRRSRRIRSAWSVEPSESPATKAPTIGASFAASASSANASVNASAIATSVPAEREYRPSARKSFGANHWPNSVVTTRNPTATPHDAQRASRGCTVPSVTIRTTTVRMTRPITSSATAAPSTVRASTVARARRSLNTRAVMPTLVAASAAPRNSAVFVS